jgi:hypothetical protein
LCNVYDLKCSKSSFKDHGRSLLDPIMLFADLATR